jgi:hypothetical protein
VERRTVGDRRRWMQQTKNERVGCAIEIVVGLGKKVAVEKGMKWWLGRREVVEKREN